MADAIIDTITTAATICTVRFMAASLAVVPMAIQALTDDTFFRR
jgi:hypothetical protein